MPSAVTHSEPAGAGGGAPWCDRCPLRQNCGFADFSAEELAFMIEFKTDHGRSWAGEVLLQQGSTTPRLMTLFSGWALKYRATDTGERHLLEVILPGDLVGLELVLGGSSPYSIEAASDITFCVLNAGRLDELLHTAEFAHRVSAIEANAYRRMAERLTAVAVSGARRNVAHFFLDLYRRLDQRQMTRDGSLPLHFRKQQIALAVGLTTVHVHRVLRGLQADGILTIDRRGITIGNLAALYEAAGTAEPHAPPAPLPFL